MTTYTTKDLDEGWEFKILRSNFAAFRNEDKLRAILEEEKRGGWILVEKFDDQRIRLKRRTGVKVTERELRPANRADRNGASGLTVHPQWFRKPRLPWCGGCVEDISLRRVSAEREQVGRAFRVNHSLGLNASARRFDHGHLLGRIGCSALS